MFEPRAFLELSTVQSQLMDALQRRDLDAFTTLLDDPAVDPDHWYGKPYWSTCLSLACTLQGCEGFVLALLRAGAGARRPTMRLGPIKVSEDNKRRYSMDSGLLKATLNLALGNESTDDDVHDDHLGAERLLRDMQECLMRTERCDKRLVALEQAQQRANAMLEEILQLLKRPA